MALRKVYDAFGEQYYIEVVEQPADSQGRIALRQIFEMGSSSAASSELAFQSDDAGSGVCYFGFAAIATATSAATWQIFKLVDTSGDLAKTWADGNATFDNVWDDRAGLSYS